MAGRSGKHGMAGTERSRPQPQTQSKESELEEGQTSKHPEVCPLLQEGLSVTHNSSLPPQTESHTWD